MKMLARLLLALLALTTVVSDAAVFSSYRVPTAAAALPGTPYYYNNFDTGTDGAVVSNMTDNSGTVYDSTQKYGGSGKSAKVQITSGNTGFGNWGGIVAITPKLQRYDEVWIRVRIRFPTGFNWTNSDGNAFLKFLRLKNETTGGTHLSYGDLYTMSPTNGAFPNGVQYIHETEQNWKYSGTTFSLAPDTWATYEVYYKLDNVAASVGGQGRGRVWKDGNLILDFNDRYTLANATAVIPYFYLYTLWNQVAPATQSGNIDDLTIYTSASPPTNTDGSGNIFIGL